jgi:hypothetical protein
MTLVTHPFLSGCLRGDRGINSGSDPFTGTCGVFWHPVVGGGRRAGRLDSH